MLSPNRSDYLERAKREEETHLIEASYQKHLVDDEIFFEQQQEVSLILILYRIFTLSFVGNINISLCMKERKISNVHHLSQL